MPPLGHPIPRSHRHVTFLAATCLWGDYLPVSRTLRRRSRRGPRDVLDQVLDSGEAEREDGARIDAIVELAHVAGPPRAADVARSWTIRRGPRRPKWKRRAPPPRRPSEIVQHMSDRSPRRAVKRGVLRTDGIAAIVTRWSTWIHRRAPRAPGIAPGGTYRVHPKGGGLHGDDDRAVDAGIPVGQCRGRPGSRSRCPPVSARVEARPGVNFWTTTSQSKKRDLCIFAT